MGNVLFYFLQVILSISFILYIICNFIQIKASESSSELDISAGKSSSGKPVANSTFNDSSEPVYTENDSSNAPPEVTHLNFGSG